ncbi:hypothetical protein [Halalkalibacter krulwichiae]|uniref:hypothetical protein n=1 Tax=Halalkalibacter krulwichiae TaxID=199441 RepID=UPI001471AB87|nr:hypothetical protein [Halalkalibacter krulwichiae]
MATQQILFLFYLILTTFFYFLAIRQGNEGVTFRFLGGGDDGMFYWEESQKIAAGQEAILTSIYPLIIGNIMRITGIESVYFIRIFNYFGFIILTFLGLYLIRLFYKLEQIKLGRDLNPIYTSKILMLLSFVCYVSLFMNISLSINRDIWIYSFYILSLILSIKVIFNKKNRFLFLILLFPSLWLLGEFRGYALASFIISIILYLLYKGFLKLRRPILTLTAFITVFGVYYTLFMDYSIPYLDMSLRGALNYRHSAITLYSGGSQMWINLDHPFFPVFFINYFHSFIGNLIGPLPWHLSGISTLFIFLFETIPMILILLFIWKKRNLLSKVQIYVLLHAFVWIGLIAVTNDNIGTATRLRAVGWILILIVFVSVYSKNRYFKKKII